MSTLVAFTCPDCGRAILAYRHGPSSPPRTLVTMASAWLLRLIPPACPVCGTPLRPEPRLQHRDEDRQRRPEEHDDHAHRK